MLTKHYEARTPQPTPAPCSVTDTDTDTRTGLSLICLTGVHVTVSWPVSMSVLHTKHLELTRTNQYITQTTS
ncbi:hypothetical protein HKD37_08G023669 [Glycine soja]